MRPVQLLVAMLLLFVFSWWTSDAQGAVAPGVVPSGNESMGPSADSSSERLIEGTAARIQRNLDPSQPGPKRVPSTLIFPSRAAILAVVCTGLGLAVTTAVAVSLRQPYASKNVPQFRVQTNFRARTWVELTKSPQF